MATEPRKLSDWLTEPTVLRDALSRTEQLAQINRALLEWLRDPWARSLRLADLEGDTAVFFVADASASTLLHFHSNAVLAFLRERFNCTCNRIQIRVRP